MHNHELEAGIPSNKRVFRQAEEEEEKPEDQDILSRQNDPLAQVKVRGSGGLLSSIQAATLNHIPTSQGPLARRSFLQLQRHYGNHYVQRVVALARKGRGESEVAPEVEETIQQARGSGQALDSGVRAQMEPAFGADFSGVRVHTGSEADTLNQAVSARAFTTGQDIFFREGEYNPGSSSGRELLAHELTHVAQQSSQVRRKLNVSQIDDPEELEADRVAKSYIQYSATQNAAEEIAQSKANNGEARERNALLQRKIVMNSVSDTGGVPKESLRTFTEQEVKHYIDAIGVTNHAFDDIIEAAGKEYSFISGPTPAKRKAYRQTLIKSIVSDMGKTSVELYFLTDDELVSEIRKRAITSLDMRVTQGMTKKYKPLGYPPRTSNSWAAVANSEARKYWQVTIVKGDYWFTLTPIGKKNAYEALIKLIFAHQITGKQTLMHCDYVISALHYKVMADSMKPDKFNEEVDKGNIQIELHDLTIGQITQAGVESKPDKSLIKVKLSSEDDLIIGDHVIFYNHPAYDDLNKNINQSWRLENAIVTDNEGPGMTKRFQGHGFFSPRSRGEFIGDMRAMFNQLVKRATGYVEANNITALNRYFTIPTSSTVFKTIEYDVEKGKIKNAKIRYHDGSVVKEISPLRELKDVDYTQPFVEPGESMIEVWRPMESRRNL